MAMTYIYIITKSLLKFSHVLSLNFEAFMIFREFQPMVFAPDDSSLSSYQDTNQFLV